jgi:hypothetical protein
LKKAAQKLFLLWGTGVGDDNAHDPDSKESFCFFFFRKRSSCRLIHPKAIML